MDARDFRSFIPARIANAKNRKYQKTKTLLTRQFEMVCVELPKEELQLAVPFLHSPRTLSG